MVSKNRLGFRCQVKQQQGTGYKKIAPGIGAKQCSKAYEYYLRQ